MVGPVIGGHLANPVQTLPFFFQPKTIWDSYPYLLPNLVVVCFTVGSGLLGFLFLEEVHPKFKHRYDIGLEISRLASRGMKRILGKPARSGYESISDIDGGAQLSAIADSEGVEKAIEEEPRDLEEPEEPHPSSPSASKSAHPELQSAYSAQVILQILAVSILAFHKVSSDVIIPMLLATPLNSTSGSSGKISRGLFKFKAGFGMDSPSISNVLLSQAVVAIIVQILLVPKIIGKYGALRNFRWAMFVFPWMYCLTPFVARLQHPLSTVVILLDLWVKGLLVGLGYVCSAIL